MASLIEELITVLTDECSVYKELEVVAMEKTRVIVSNDLIKLQSIVATEQEILDRVVNLDKKRDMAIREIGTVLGRDVEKITVTEIIGLMSNQPEFEKPLQEVHKQLRDIVFKVKSINEHNRDLLENALEMTQISVNLLQNMNRAPETANYGKGTYNGDLLGTAKARFDTKQ